jgi:hypothetical protein
MRRLRAKINGSRAASKVGAIAHLNNILNGGHITSAVLVDPWFGAEALTRFVLRLGSQNVRLTIVTSWTDVDPDTDIPLDPAESSTKKLEAALGQVGPFLSPRLTVVNLVDDKALSLDLSARTCPKSLSAVEQHQQAGRQLAVRHEPSGRRRRPRGPALYRGAMRRQG